MLFKHGYTGVHQKIKMMSFIYPHVSANLYDLLAFVELKDILRNGETTTKNEISSI